MNNFLLKGTIVILSLLNANAFASEMDKMFYWSNANGLVSAENCKLETSKDSKLGFVKSASYTYVNLEKNKGLSNLNIASGSLVKIGNIDPETGKTTVEVVGINTAFTAIMPEGIRGDEGIVEAKEIETITKNLIQIKENYMNAIGGTYWKVYAKDKFLKLNCPEFNGTKDYFVFSVYPEDGGRMIARVGVSASETELFQNIKTFSESEIYNKLTDAAADESSSLAELDLLPEASSTPVKTETPLDEKDVPEIQEEKETPEVNTQKGVDTIICTPQKSINVRNEKLNAVLFVAKNGSRVKIFQGWGNNKVEGTVDGKKYEFIKVEFLDNEDQNEKTGYVVSSFVEAKSTCIHNPGYRDSLKPEDKSLSSINDKACCNFPIMNKPSQKFTVGTPRFGASRSDGRTHAAVDLYRAIDEPVYAVAPGVVIRSLEPFYEGTYALEVLHSGGFIVRYGEMTAKQVKNVSIGKQIKKGDRVGYIAKINTAKGCCVPMLHVEIYSGKLRGPLSQEGARINGILYARRKDLIDPTKHMLKWQNEKFKK